MSIEKIREILTADGYDKYIFWGICIFIFFIFSILSKQNFGVKGIVIKDLHLAFRQSFYAFRKAGIGLICLFLLSLVCIIIFCEKETNETLIFLLSIITGISATLFIYYPAIVFGNYNSGSLISSAQNEIDIVSHNLENSFFDWLMLRPYWQLCLRRKIKITDIKYMHYHSFDTKRTRWFFAKDKGDHVAIKHYTLNIAGDFGSIMLDFSNSQKRDEFVGNMKQAMEDLDHKISIRLWDQ